VSALSVDIGEKLWPATAGAAPRPALQQIRFAVAPGETVALLGPSGCGKTTLLNIVAGLDRDYAGEVRLGEPSPGRTARLGYVFQNPRLLPWRTVLDNVRLPLEPAADARRRAVALLAAVGLAESASVYPQRLSTGMARRVAIARALAVEPDLLLLDEPFVSLDEATARLVRRLVAAERTRRPVTTLLITHALGDALALADRLLLLSPSPGRLVAEVPVELSAAARRDEDAVERFRRRLRERFPAVFRSGPVLAAEGQGGGARDSPRSSSSGTP
jgi:NitT/TauT family transport system ATP-binding protein